MKIKKYGEYVDGYQADVTAVIPVYNSEKFLARCINSLIFQTNINMEIIIVIDDGTTDSSTEIALKYVENFPGKVFCIIKEGVGLSPARKMGMEHSTTSYIIFVDVDDYVDQKLCEHCYKLAVENDADIVSYNFAEYTSYKNRLEDYKATPALKTQSISEALEMGGICWWKFMFSVEFLKKEAHFYDMFWEDASEIPTLISKAKNYVMTPSVLYYKIKNDESMSEAFSPNSKRIYEHTLANKMTLDNVNPKYFSSACFKTGRRMVFSFMKFPSYYDHFVEHMQEYRWIYSFKNDVWNKLTDFERSYVNKILALDAPSIPLNIYINGFSKENIDEYQNRAKAGFWNCENLICLDETNCDVNKNSYIKKMYKEKQYNLIAEYFALEKIYEDGGIYIGKNLHLTSSFNRLRYNTSFWGFETSKSFTNEVFGAQKADPIVCEILKTYEFPTLYNDSYVHVGHRIKTILVGKCGVKMTGREQLKDGAIICPASVFVVNTGEMNKNISWVDYKDEHVSISRPVFKHVVDYLNENIEYFKWENNNLKNELNNVKKNYIVNEKVIPDLSKQTQLENIIKDKDQEIQDLKNSFTYKVGYVVTYIPRMIYVLIFGKNYNARKKGL